MIRLNITFILQVTICGGVQIVCLAIWMVFHHSQMSLTAGQFFFSMVFEVLQLKLIFGR